MQRWPGRPEGATTGSRPTARSRSASASTTTAFLPPSSRRQPLERAGRPARRCACPVADAARERDDRRRPGCRRSRRRPRRRVPVTRLTTPGGKPASCHQLDEQRRAVGRVADAGLKTTVLPVTSAGIIFQHGIAIGKFQGVMMPGDPDRLADAHRPLVGQLGRHRVAEHPAALAGHQERDVDPLLDVAARLGEDLAHLAGHRSGQALLVLGHERAEARTGSRRASGRACAATSGGRFRPP